MSEKLPAGVWYDAPNRRYRVRRYKNCKAHLVGYYPTLPEALTALHELNTVLDQKPTRRRGWRKQIEAPRATFSSLARAALATD